ncbi:MAG: hypothetical protein E4H10_05685, partial [Bacteroidia bacterium]
GDTIIYADKLSVDIRLLALIRNKVVLENVDLSQASVKLQMNEESLKYNIDEAFTSGIKAEVKPKDKTKADWFISILDGSLRSIHFQMSDSISGIHILQDIEAIRLKNFSILLAEQEIRAHTLELVKAEGYVSLASQETDSTNEDEKPWKFALLNLYMNDIDFTFDQEPEDLVMHLILGEGEIRAKEIDLITRVVDIKSISLKEANATILSSNQAGDPQSSPQPEPGESPWFIQGKDIDLEKIDISFGTHPGVGTDSTGTGYNLTGLEMKLKDLVFDQDQDQAGFKLKQLSFDLNNGFLLKNMKGEMDSDRESTKLNLALETDRSNVNLEGQANQSLSSILSQPEEIQNADLALSKTSISLKDFYPFIREWQGNPKITTLASQPISVSGDLEMMKSHRTLSGVSFSQHRNFHVAIEGKVADPFSFSEATGDLKLGITEVDTSWMKELLRGFGMGKDFSAMGGIIVEGNVSKSLSSSEFGLELRSDLGNVTGTGSLVFRTYSFSVQTTFENILLGEALELEELGAFSGSAIISGHGFTPENFQSSLTLLVDSLRFKDYNYTQTHIEGMFQPGEYNFHLVANDPFFAGDLRAQLIPADSALRLEASGSVKAQLNELHLFEDTLSLNTSLDASILYRQNFLESELSASDIVLADMYQRIEIKQLKTTFQADSLYTTLRATGDFFHLDMQVARGFSNLDSFGVYYRDYFSTFTDPQHPNASTRVLSLPEINVSSKITHHKALNMILQDTGFHISNLDLSMKHHVSENRINYGIKGQGLSYKMAELDSLEVAVIDSAGGMNIKVNLDDISLFSGPEYDWLLQSSFANWRNLTSFSVQDPLGHMVYDLEIASRIDSSNVVLEIPSKTLILNREQWHMETPDLLSVNWSTQTITPALSMYTGSSFLHLFELTEEGKRTFIMDMNQVEIESLVREDLFPGRPNASITGSIGLSTPSDSITRIVSDLHFAHVNYSDLKFDNISVIGHLELDDSGNYSMDMDARLDSARIHLKGRKAVGGERQIQSNFSQFPIKLAQPFTKETLSDLRGFISGEFDVSNTTGSDRVDGQLSFQGVRVRINALNSTFHVPDQGLFVADEKLLFKNFRILDTLSNELLVNGFLDFQNIDQVNTDLNISSLKLQVMSRGGEDDDTPFYGNVFVDSKFSVKGPLVNPTIKGNVRLSRGTEVFYRHMEDLSMSESQKILSFVSNTTQDVPLVSPVSNRQGAFIKSSVETIVEIDPSTLINVNLSKRIYDLELQIKGGGKLNYGMLNNNQMSLSGRYVISDGAAELKLVGWPNKSFRIAEGGYIRWDGRVEDPELSFRALNRVSSSYQNPVDGKQRPVDFDVLLQLTDHLSDLEVLFTVNTSDQYLMSIINTLSPEEQMRQAISILLFEVIDLPGISSSSNYMSQQVNQILASQLNQLTQSAIKGVDISFGLDTYTSNQSGGDETSTSLSYEVRKSLMNDRAHIEVSGRLRDMNQSAGATNNALNNISLEYSLDSAATKFMKVYNEHTYDDVFEGEVIKTGIGFFVRKRHRHLRDIWKRERKDKKGKKEKSEEE